MPVAQQMPQVQIYHLGLHPTTAHLAGELAVMAQLQIDRATTRLTLNEALLQVKVEIDGLPAGIAGGLVAIVIDGHLIAGAVGPSVQLDQLGTPLLLEIDALRMGLTGNGGALGVGADIDLISEGLSGNRLLTTIEIEVGAAGRELAANPAELGRSLDCHFRVLPLGQAFFCLEGCGPDPEATLALPTRRQVANLLIGPRIEKDIERTT